MSEFEDNFWQYAKGDFKSNFTYHEQFSTDYPNLCYPNDSFTTNKTFVNAAYMTCKTDSYRDFSEPPLLDELEIYPDRIITKTLAILNPFHSATRQLTDLPDIFRDADLAGPITFCVVFAASLYLQGSKTYFGYIYTLSLISIVGMYMLMSLMCNSATNFISLSGVASILGYSLLPIVFLSTVGIFLSINSPTGRVVAMAAVYLSTMTSSRMFCLMIGDKDQRFLLAYPCALIYVIFVLLIFF